MHDKEAILNSYYLFWESALISTDASEIHSKIRRALSSGIYKLYSIIHVWYEGHHIDEIKLDMVLEDIMNEITKTIYEEHSHPPIN